MKRLLSIFLSLILASGFMASMGPGVFCPSMELFAISDDHYSDAQSTFNAENDIDINAAEGWALFKDLCSDPQPVIVAVIDSGVDTTHPDLAGKIWVNEGEIPDNGIDDDGNGYIDDINGWDFYNNDNTVCHYITDDKTGTYTSDPDDCDDHGTHIAGIIAAEADNGIGIAGIASCTDVKIMSLKTYGGPKQSSTIEDAIRAIRYAENMGASICNISWGTLKSSKKLRNAIKNSSMLFCVAAGNSGENIDEKNVYPASYSLSNVLVCGYTDEDGGLAAFSNYGSKSVDVAVPAKNVYSTIVGGYAYMSGSSMAAPHLSGIAAVLYSYLGKVPPDYICEIICSSIKYDAALEGKTAFPGIPDLAYSLAYAAESEYIPPEEAPDYTLAKFYIDGKLQLMLVPKSNDNSENLRLRYLIGNRDVEIFKNGTGGLEVEDNTIILDKDGKYTIYCSDKSGNEFIRTYLITDDTLPPKIEDLAFSVADDYSKITISGKASDLQSGIKKVKFLKGKHTVGDFSGNSGEEVETDEYGYFSFDVAEEGTYTVYTVDRRNNKTVSTIMCYIRRSVSITLDITKKKLKVGKTFLLEPVIYPARSTDKLTFTSSKKKVASVSADGLIKAKKAGKTTITITASSGATAKLVVTVK